MNRWTLVCGLSVIVTVVGCSGADTNGIEPTAIPGGPVVAEGPGTVAATDGVKIAFTVHRIGRPNLVLVHGWMCDQSYWDEQVPGLVEGFGVITVDVAGHGDSGVARQSWTITSLVGDVVTVVEELQLDGVIVVGHSMGGMVALDVARALPRRVIGVIGVDSLHDSDPDFDLEEMAPLYAGFENDFVGTCDGFVRGMFVDGTEPGLIDGVAADMCGGPEDVGLGLMRAYPEYDWPRGFAEAGVPIRSINADLWPTDLEGNRKVADYDLTVLPGYGHFLMQEAPDELTKALIVTARNIVADGHQPTK